MLEKIKCELLVKPSNYAEAKIQAEKLDGLFGFELEQIESDLTRSQQEEGRQFWIGLDVQSLQTPYSEIAQIIEQLNPQASQVWMDLGAAYGRLGLVLGLQRPEVRFLGYEFVQERVIEGNRIRAKWQIQNGDLIQADLVRDEIFFVQGDVFFLYDFGSRKDVYQVLQKLQSVAAQKPICVVARGRGVKNWIMLDFPWLAEVNSSLHFENWSAFFS